MKIEKAIDWNQVSIKIQQQLSSIGYNPDLQKMYRNIDKMVTELSKIEVSFRRVNKSNNLTESKVKQINNSIDHLEKLIIMAKLMT